MSEKRKEPAESTKSSVFGRIGGLFFGGGKPPSGASAKKKITVAKLPEGNEFYYDAETKTWKERGKEHEAAATAALSSPPKSFTSSCHPSSNSLAGMDTGENPNSPLQSKTPSTGNLGSLSPPGGNVYSNRGSFKNIQNRYVNVTGQKLGQSGSMGSSGSLNGLMARLGSAPQPHTGSGPLVPGAHTIPGVLRVGRAGTKHLVSPFHGMQPFQSVSMFVPQTAQQVSSAGGSPAVLIPPSAGKPDPVRPGETGVTDSVEPSTEEDIWGASQLSPGPPAMFVPMASPSAELVSCQGSVSFDAGSSSPESSTPPHMFMPTAPGRDKLQDLAEQSTDTSLPAVMDSHEDSAGHDITLSGNAGNRNPASPPRMFTPMMPNWSVISAIDSDVVASTTADGMPQFRVASTCSAAASSGDAAEGGPPDGGMPVLAPEESKETYCGGVSAAMESSKPQQYSADMSTLFAQTVIHGHSASGADFFAQLPSPATGSPPISDPGADAELSVPGPSNLKESSGIYCRSSMDWGTESHEGVTCLGELCQNITNMDMPLDEDVQKFVSDGDSFAVNNPVNGIHHDSQVYEQQVQGVGYFENEQEGHGSNLEQQQAEGYGYVPYVDAEGNWQYYYGEMSSDEYKYYYECYCNYYAQYGQQEGVGGQQNDCQQHVEQQDSAIDPQFRDDLEQHGNDRGDSQSVAEEAATPVPDVAAQGVTLDEAQQAPIEGHAIRDDFAMNGDAYPPDASSVGAPDVDAIPGPSGDDVDGREVMRDVSIGDTTDEALEEAPEYLGMNLEAFVHCPTELEVPVMVAAVIEPQLGDLDLRNPASVPENSSAVPSNSRDLGTETARSLGCCTNHPEKDTSLDSWVPERDSEHAAPVESIPAEAIAPDDVQSEHPPSNPRPHRKPRERQKPKAKLAKALPWETDAAGDSQPLGSSPLRVGGMLDVDLEEDLVPLPQVPLPSQSAAPGRGMSMDHTPVQLLADAARCNEGQADSDGWDDEPSMPILANDLGQHSGTSVGSVLVGSVVVAAAAIQEQSDSITGVARTGELDDALPMPQSDADQHMQGSISSMLSRKSTHSSAADVNAAFVAEEQGSVDGREHDSPGFDGSIAEVPTCAQSSEVGALPFVGMHHVLPSDEHHSGSALETFAKDDHMQPIEQPGTTCNGFGQHLHVDIQHTAPKASTGNGIHAQRIYFRDFMGAAANKNAIWQGKSLLPDRLKGPAEELIADIPLNAASNPLDSRRTTKSKPANSPKNKAKKAVESVNRGAIGEAIKSVMRSIHSYQAAEIKYKDVSHCRLGALEQENVMLRVGRKASADHCQSLEIQLAGMEEEKILKSAKLAKHIRRPCRAILSVQTGTGDVRVSLEVRSPTKQMVQEFEELHEELCRRSEEVQRLLDLEGGQTALLQKQLDERSCEVQALLEMEQENMLLVQNLADREGKLHALKQEVTQLQSLATEFTAFQENFSKNHRQLEQEVEHLSDIVSGMDTQTEAGSAPLQALERLSQLVAQLESKTTFAAEAGMEAASVSWATVQVLEEQLAILASQLEGSISRVSELEATLVSARESAEAAIEEANLRARMAEAQASDLEAKAGTTGYSQSQELQSQLAAAEDEVTRLLDEQEEFFNVEAELQRKIRVLEEQLADSANEMENTSKLLSLASGERDAAEAHATTAREELAMVEAAKDRAVGECENLRWELDAAQKKVASAEARLEAAKQKELQLEEEKAAAISEAVAANERADRASQNSSMEAKEALAAAHKEAEDAKSKWRAAIKKGKAIEKEKKELEGKLKSALRRCEEAEQRCSDAEVAASSSRDVLVAELASLREQLEDAHSEMAALKDGLHEALAGERAAQEQAATWEDAFNNIAGAAQSALQAAEAFERLAEPRRALDAGLIQAAYCAATEAKAAAEAAAAVPDYRAELDEAEEIKNKLRAAIKKGRAIEEEKNDLQVRLEQSMQRCAETERRCSDAEAAAASLQESSAEELAVLHLRLEEACAEAVALKEGLLEALAAKTAAQEQAATSQNTLTDVAGVAHSTLRAAKAIDGMVEFRRVLDAELASVAGCAVDSAIASSRQVEAAAAAAAVSDHSSELAEVKEVKNKLRAAIKKGKAIEKDKKYLEVQLQQALDRAAEAERRCAAAEAANPAPGLPGRDLIALQERLEEAQAESDALKAGLHEALVAETAAQEQTATLEESFADVHRAAQSALKAAGAADELVESRSILEAELSQIAHEAVVAATSGASHVPGLSAEIERLQQEILSLKAETKAAEERMTTLEQENQELREIVDTQQNEFNDLLACLGQETAKVAGLQDALAEQGVDAGAILEKVEAEYGFGEDDEDVRDEDLQ